MEKQRGNPSHQEEEEDSEDSDNPEAEIWFYKGKQLRGNPLPKTVKLGGNRLHTEPGLQLIRKSQKETVTPAIVDRSEGFFSVFFSFFHLLHFHVLIIFLFIFQKKRFRVFIVSSCFLLFFFFSFFPPPSPELSRAPLPP